MTRTIRSENLHWVKSERRFHADASTLCFLPGMPMPRRIEVVSARTGESAFFNLTDLLARGSRRTQRGPDGRGVGEGWAYTPDPNCRHNAATLGVFIWNT